MAKAKKAVSNIVVSVFAFLLIIGAIGALLHFSGIGDKIKRRLSDFSVECNGSKYTSAENYVAIPSDGIVRFYVNGASDYALSIGVPSGEYADSDLMKIKDCVSLSDNYFELDCNKLDIQNYPQFSIPLVITANNKTVTLYLGYIQSIELSTDNIVF